MILGGPPMLKVVIVEQDQVAKDVIFLLQDILKEAFTFTHYEKIVDLIRENNRSYDIIILNGEYDSDRITNALDFKKTNSVYIYITNKKKMAPIDTYCRVFYINRNEYKECLLKQKDCINTCLMSHQEYLFSYNGVTVHLKFHDIFYLVKANKDLIYYTRKGVFMERGSIREKEEEFKVYGFIRVNAGTLVNYDYIFKIDGDELEMNNHEHLLISRSRKASLVSFVRKRSIMERERQS